MGGIVVLSVIYWIAVFGLVLVGVVKIIAAWVNDRPAKPGLKLLILALIFFVIGAGACALLIGGISVR